MTLRHDDEIPGFDSHGRAFLVPSPAERGRGRGAILGLVIGAGAGHKAARGEPVVDEASIGAGSFPVSHEVALAAGLTEHLMRRGLLDVTELARAYHDGCAGTEGPEPILASSPLGRTLPVGLFFAGQPGRLVEEALAETAITHAEPVVRLACASFDAAIAAAAYDQSDGRGAMIAAVKALDVAAAALSAGAPENRADLRDAIAKARADLRSDVEAAVGAAHIATGDLDLEAADGLARATYRHAFWHLLHTTSPLAAVLDVIRAAGDSTAAGAVVGALLGALRGEDAWPKPLRALAAEALRHLATTLGAPASMLTLVP